MFRSNISYKAVGATIAGLFALGGPAVAQQLDVSSNLTITSDWEWRGISLTRAFPAAYGSITAAYSGFYGGIFGGSWDGPDNIDNPDDPNDESGNSNMGITIYAGYGGDVGIEGLSYNIEGAYNIAYGAPRESTPTAADNGGNENSTYFGFWAGLNYSQDAFSVNARAYYDYYPDIWLDGNGSEYANPDTAMNNLDLVPDSGETQGLGSKSAIYLWGNASYTIQGFTIGVDVGKFIEALDGFTPYLHYGVTASYDLGYGTAVGAKWYANDMRIETGVTGDALRSQFGTDGRFLVYITTDLAFDLGMSDQRS